MEAAQEAVAKFFDDSPFQFSAALSFYTVLSLSPLVLIVVAAAGLVWGEQPMRSELLSQIEDPIGQDGANTVRTVMERTTLARQSIGSMTLGVIVMGFLLLVSLLVSALLAAFHGYLFRTFPGAGRLWELVNFLISLLVIAVLIAMVYRVLPDVRLAWPDVWIGAATTSVLFGVGKLLIGLYLGHASIGSSYGAAGSLVVFLVWVYYSSLIMFFGAEITFVYAQHRRRRIAPAEPAVKATR